jgi:arylsulfatase A-like enzyme
MSAETTRPAPVRGVGLPVGAVAGALVGALDGLRASMLSRIDAPGTLSAMLLAACVDALVGAALGGAVELLVRAARWGSARTPRWWARAIGFVVAGALPAAAVAQAIASTSGRVNRLLAAGIVALAALFVAAAGAALAPAIGRLVGGHRAAEATRPVRAAAALLVAPALAAVGGAAVFVFVWRTRAPLRGAALIERELWAAGAAALLPWLVSVGARVALPLRPRVAGAIAGAAALAILLPFGITRWERDLRFVPFEHGLVLLAILAVAAAVARPLSARLASGRRALVASFVAVAVALVGSIEAAGAEAARKALAAHAGVAGPLLAAARTALDFDHDGYPSLLGGGDCDDHDPKRNPAALDVPEDGIDQDCDGADATIASLASPPFHAVPDSVPRDLDVVFVTVDTLRADHLGTYGYGKPTSPEIDRLASEAIVFDNGWAHAPSTRYSMPAIATSRWPSAIAWEDCWGCASWWPRFAASQRTIAEAFKRTGYFTAAFYAFEYFNKSEHRGFERGVDLYDDRRAALHRNVAGPAESVGSSAREISDDAIAFLDAHREGKFFLWLHYYDPHLDYQRHPDVPDFGPDRRGGYDGEIRFTDLQLGRVLARLRELGMWDRTAIVVTGDHGEGLGERGIDAHGYHLYPPQTKVPFILRVPGLPARRIATPIGHVDLAPTLLNLARGEKEPTFLGRSMVDVMSGGAIDDPPPGPVFQEVTYENDNAKRALVTETRQLVWNWTPHNTTECYDLRLGTEGPDQWSTSAGEPDCSRLKAELRRRVALLSLPPDYRDKVAFGVVKPGSAAPAPQVKADARLGDAIRFVGYDLAPGTVVPRGAEVEVTYHFDVLAPLPPGWALFFHLSGPNGYRNLDHVPVGGAYPLERWKPGERIRDRHSFRIDANAPPGTYTIWLGAWHRKDGRLPITPPEAADGDRRARAVTFEVR